MANSLLNVLLIPSACFATARTVFYAWLVYMQKMAIRGPGLSLRSRQSPIAGKPAADIIQRLVIVLLLGTTSSAQAGLFCSDSPFNSVVDGSVDYTLIDPSFVFPTQITIDTDCTFQNFTAANPLTATLNFQTNDPSVYLITFDNVIFTGNMACANVDHRIWLVNGSDYGSNNNCQDLFIPVEAINKRNPAGTTTVGTLPLHSFILRI